MISRYLFATAGALALAACGGGSDNADEAQSEDAMAQATAAPAEAATPDAAQPQGFVDAMAASDMFEIEAGKLAQEMGKSEKVKAFGAMMVKDHTASSDKLKATVAEAGNGLTISPALTPAHEANLQELRTAGDNFDATYARQQVAAHEQALAMLQGQSRTSAVPQLQALAASTAPVVEGHLGEARQLP